MIKRSYRRFLQSYISYIKENDSEDRVVKIDYKDNQDIHDQLLEFFQEIEDNFDVNVVIPKNFLIDGRPELGVNISPSTNRIEDVDILELFGSIWTSVRRLRKMGIFETLIYDSKGSWGQIRLSRNPFKDIIIKFNDLMMSDPNIILKEIQNSVDMETIENWIISLDFQIPEAKYKEMIQLNENVSLAKSILKKSGIDSNSPEWNDYLRIREICGDSYGYVGILTRIRFEDGVKDMDEIRSIYDILKGSKIDLSKLNKMSYNDILDQFYDKFSKDSSDIEMVFSDSQYTYYIVKTYDGILKIGSPAWCLKTKSNWDHYQKLYPHQWVVVNNRYKNKLITPNTNTLMDYNPKDGWTRYGISLNLSSDGKKIEMWTGNNDGNGSVSFTPDSYTFWGVMSTILNIIRGHKKSYWEYFPGCQPIDGSKKLHKIVNREIVFPRIGVDSRDLQLSNQDTEIYISLSETYSAPPMLLILGINPRVFYPVSNRKNFKLKYSVLSGSLSKGLIEEYAKNSTLDIYTGIKLKLDILTKEEALSRSIGNVDNWAIFDTSSRQYLCVNLNPIEYRIPTLTKNEEQCDIDDPLYFYLNKSNLKPVSLRGGKMPIKSHHQVVIDYLNKKNQKRVRGFWSFLKNK